jgi:hypothetical protein
MTGFFLPRKLPLTPRRRLASCMSFGSEDVDKDCFVPSSHRCYHEGVIRPNNSKLILSMLKKRAAIIRMQLSGLTNRGSRSSLPHQNRDPS